MAAVLLDTDVFSYLLKGGDRAAPYEKHVSGKTVAITFITVGELYAGADRKHWGHKKRAALERRLHAVVVVPYDIEICKAYARLYSIKTPQGSARTIAANDRWIAACAIRHNLPLVTNNRRHFEDIPGLNIITEAPVPKRPKSAKLPLDLAAPSDAEPSPSE